MAKPEIKWCCGVRSCPGAPINAIRWHAGHQPVALICKDHKYTLLIEPYAELLGVACNLIVEAA